MNHLRSAQRNLTRLLALATLLVSVALPATAQYNGPASIAGTAELNRPTSLTTDRSVLFPVIHEQVLQPGDGITIRIFGQTDYAPAVRIGLDGTAQLPLIGVVSLRGLTITQAEGLIASRLVSAGMYRDPQVTVQITEGPNSVVTIVGESHALVPISGSRRLFDVLSTAGAFPATASHIVTINRPGVPEPIVVDLGSDPLRSELANIPVFAGDTIVIARIGVVYVLGAFKTDGLISLSSYSPLTLTQATALSGGILYTGKYRDMRLIRTIGNERTVVKLDIKAVMDGKAPDPILQANDILYLPPSAIKGAIQNGGIGTLFGAVSLALTVLFYVHN